MPRLTVPGRRGASSIICLVGNGGSRSFRLVRALVRWFKSVEPTLITMREQRGPILEDAGRNLLLVKADDL